MDSYVKDSIIDHRSFNKKNLEEKCEFWSDYDTVPFLKCDRGFIEVHCNNGHFEPLKIS